MLFTSALDDHHGLGTPCSQQESGWDLLAHMMGMEGDRASGLFSWNKFLPCSRMLVTREGVVSLAFSVAPPHFFITHPHSGRLSWRGWRCVGMRSLSLAGAKSCQGNQGEVVLSRSWNDLVTPGIALAAHHAWPLWGHTTTAELTSEIMRLKFSEVRLLK